MADPASDFHPPLGGGTGTAVFDHSDDGVIGFEPCGCLPGGLTNVAEQHVVLGEGDLAVFHASDEFGILDGYQRGAAMPVGQAPLLAGLERQVDDREHLRVAGLEQPVFYDGRRQESTGGLLRDPLFEAFTFEDDLVDARTAQGLDSDALQGVAEIRIESDARRCPIDFNLGLVVELDDNVPSAAMNPPRRATGNMPNQGNGAAADGCSEADHADELQNRVHIGADEEVADDMVGALRLYRQFYPKAAIADRPHFHGNVECVAIHDAVGCLHHLPERDQSRCEIRHVDLVVLERRAIEFQAEGRGRHWARPVRRGSEAIITVPLAVRTIQPITRSAETRLTASKVLTASLLQRDKGAFDIDEI